MQNPVAPREARLQKLAFSGASLFHSRRVAFWWYVHREASELDLCGWVRDTEDGEVEVVASGHVEDLAELRASLRRGPRCGLRYPAPSVAG